MPETEFSEVVIQVSNDTSKNYIVETVPPNLQIAGLLVNPLVIDLKAGRSALICIRYNSQFRDLTLKKMEELFKPKFDSNNKPGLGNKNKKLEERLKKEKEDALKEVPVDPKAKAGAKAAPVAAKKEEVKKPDPKAPKKTP